MSRNASTRRAGYSQDTGNDDATSDETKITPLAETNNKRATCTVKRTQGRTSVGRAARV